MERGFIILPIISAPLILLSPVFLTGKALFWGTPLLQFVPWWHAAVQSLRAGDLPLWNPLSGMGAPLLGNYQSGLLYPPYWPLLFMDFVGGLELMAWGQALVIALHWMIASLGMARLVRALGFGALGQLVSGLAYGLSSYLVARSIFPSMNAAAAWTPWVLVGIWNLAGSHRSEPGEVSRGSLRTVLKHLPAWLSLVIPLTLQLLAGHAQIAWYTLLLGGFWTMYLGWTRASGGVAIRVKSIFLLLSRFAAAGIYSVMLSAVQLIPTAEYLLHSQRSSNVEFDFAMTYSTWPWRFLGLISPELFGTPARGDYWGYATFWEDALYIGLLPLLLALAGVFRRQQSGRRLNLSKGGLTLFCLLVLLFSVTFALGKNTAVFPWLYENIPTFNMFQAPARYLIWATLVLALLAGLGADGWRRPEGRALYWTRLGTAGAVAVTLGAFLALALLGNVTPTYIRGFALAGFWGVGAGILSLLAPLASDGQSARVGKWHWAVAVWVAADLLFAGWGLNPGVDLNVYSSRIDYGAAARQAGASGKVGEWGRVYLSPEDEYSLKFEHFFDFAGFEPDEEWAAIRSSLLPNANILEVIPSANNFDPLQPGRYARWMVGLETLPEASKRNALNLMGVSVVEKVYLGGGNNFQFVPLAEASRVQFYNCAVFVQDEEQAFAVTVSGQVGGAKQAVIEDEPEGEMDCWQRGSFGTAFLVKETPNQVTIQVQAEQDGWLVLADTYYPGWHAWVDGEPVEIHPANYLFRGIPVAAGDHNIVFRYRPLSFWLGFVLSALAWASLVSVLVIYRRTEQGPLKPADG